MTLTELDVAKIREELEASGVTLSSLKDDLLDHLCCDIEYRMKNGEPFERSLNDSIRELAPVGLKEIENETIFLLNNKLIPMKKLMYLIGMISSMMLAAGWLMNVLHLPGAFEIGSFGLFGFVVLFLPLFAISRFKSAVVMTSYEKTWIMMGLASGIITSIGVSFKLLHLPGANLAILVGTSLFILGFLPSLFFSLYKKSAA